MALTPMSTRLPSSSRVRLELLRGCHRVIFITSAFVVVLSGRSVVLGWFAQSKSLFSCTVWLCAFAGIQSYQPPLIVSDRPDPPYDVYLDGCGANTAELMWDVKSDNNDPITEYIVYHHTNFDEPGDFHENTRLAPQAGKRTRRR